ncbi:MAG: hypothetical protein HY885_15290 [Deltaproteobacteria bacterium]|nr:hypothetical protein [Deltaproteobacteria bacterium]
MISLDRIKPQVCFTVFFQICQAQTEPVPGERISWPQSDSFEKTFSGLIEVPAPRCIATKSYLDKMVIAWPTATWINPADCLATKLLPLDNPHKDLNHAVGEPRIKEIEGSRQFEPTQAGMKLINEILQSHCRSFIITLGGSLLPFFGQLLNLLG